VVVVTGTVVVVVVVGGTVVVVVVVVGGTVVVVVVVGGTVVVVVVVVGGTVVVVVVVVGGSVGGVVVGGMVSGGPEGDVGTGAETGGLAGGGNGLNTGRGARNEGSTPAGAADFVAATGAKALRKGFGRVVVVDVNGSPTGSGNKVVGGDGGGSVFEGGIVTAVIAAPRWGMKCTIPKATRIAAQTPITIFVLK
jgi:hypothetical protein